MPVASSAPRSSRARWITRGLVALALALVAVVGWRAWTARQAAAAASEYRTATIERGQIRQVISATGSLGAISTVDVGSQISGQVLEVLVDFNDRVTRGQVIARIDPSTYQAQITQGDAAVANARAQLASAQAQLANARTDYARKAGLAERQLVARSDVDLARAARDQAQAQVTAATAQIAQQRASTLTSRLNLDRSVIRAPVDGVVLTRTVEPGQTVAASLQAPVLFQIAEDLAQMEIVLAIDEADIGQVKVGQGVDFTVDAFPDRRFRGRVQQVRLSATNTSNVITYPVVVAVDNPGQVLLPGMTANAEIEVSTRPDVLRVPNAALRFKPSDAMQAGPGNGPVTGGARGGMAEDLPRIASALRLDATQQAAFDAAVEQLRQRMAARRAAPAAGGGATLFGGGAGMRGPGGGSAGANGGAGGQMRQRMAERMAQQFAAFRATLAPAQQARWDAELAALSSARRAPLYLLVDGAPVARTVRVGASDGSYTEVSGPVEAGETVITGGGRATAAP